MNNTIKTNYMFADEKSKKEFIGFCESEYDGQVMSVASALAATEGLRFVALSGPSCSGKTTTSKRLVDDFASVGKTVKVISIDDFYIDRDMLMMRAALAGKELDLDSPSTIDNDFLSVCIGKIIRREHVKLPHYNFMLGKRDGYLPFDSASVDLFIFEGIQAIYPEFRELFGKSQLATIYICPSSSIVSHGVTFEPTELRYARRIVRDFRSRAAAPEYSMYLWKSVRANEELHIFPYGNKADYIIDSVMAYEPAVIKKQLLEILSRIPVGNEYYDDGRRLAEKYRDIPDIDAAFVPDGSVFREFIGERT